MKSAQPSGPISKATSHGPFASTWVLVTSNQQFLADESIQPFTNRGKIVRLRKDIAALEEHKHWLERERKELTGVPDRATEAKMRTNVEQLLDTENKLFEKEAEILELKKQLTGRVPLWTDDFSNLFDVLNHCRGGTKRS